MCKIIHGVYTPVGSRPVMAGMFDPVHYGVPHLHIWGSHINFCAQDFFSIPIFTRTHSPEQAQVFFNTPLRKYISFTWFSGSALLSSDFFTGRVIDVGQSLFY